ncbi:restriction endonuclease subunit S [Acidithiobacillus sp.]|uniref:restriction endonuclease subunit S n=1 Tax=Acidithiobacillus sp. TaxID=1872118 RepID=UPI0025B98E1A|nr:restriction endonuclease subunit S [Acidithiobacillus sp.]
MSTLSEVPFEEAFISVPVGKRKIQESEYDPVGSICVVDQGQNLVSGHTDRNDLLIDDWPYIIFGDHTRIVKYVDFPFVAGADGVRLYKAAADFDPEYLFLFLRSANLPVDGYGRHSKYLKELAVPNIDRDEQRQIATCLKAQLAEVETARQAVQAQLSDSRLLRSRLLKEFFAELDAAPKRKLGDYAQTTSGSTPSRSNKQYWQPAEIAWVKTGEVAFAPITATEETISKAALAECSLSLLPPKTILIAMYGQGKTRGQSAILEIPAATNQACFAILPNDTWEPNFLYLWLKSSYQDLRDLSEDRGGNECGQPN